MLSTKVKHMDHHAYGKLLSIVFILLPIYMFKYDNVVMSDKGTSDVVTSLSWLKIGPIKNMIHMIGKLENCLARKDTHNPDCTSLLSTLTTKQNIHLFNK